MSVVVDCDKRPILRIKNVLFGSLYERMISIIDEESLILSKDLDRLIEVMYSVGYGIGCDIANYIKTKKDFMQLAYIVKRGLEEEHKEYPFREDALELLMNFHAELLKYGNKLS